MLGKIGNRNIERQYIVELINENNEKTEIIESMQKENSSEDVKKLEEEIETLKYENKLLYQQNKETPSDDVEELQKKVKQLEKENKHIKENVKKPAIVGYNNLFEDIKNEKCIKFLRPNAPSNRKRFKQFKQKPFVFEFDGKGAIYNDEDLIGMYEKNKNCIKYYSLKTPPISLSAEILYTIMGCEESSFDCKVKSNMKYGKSMKNMGLKDIIKQDPVLDLRLKKFRSNKHRQYVYTEQDGSDYIIKDQKEYV